MNSPIQRYNYDIKVDSQSADGRKIGLIAPVLYSESPSALTVDRWRHTSARRNRFATVTDYKGIVRVVFSCSIP